MYISYCRARSSLLFSIIQAAYMCHILQIMLFQHKLALKQIHYITQCAINIYTSIGCKKIVAAFPNPPHHTVKTP